ncbi:MAG: hypothetical protein V2J20_11730 [Wenzhouxiangella sp.]|jgi:hypothetical protein|nr:hypothetical protein [Wenzhouxiangella sp.]
MRRNAIKLIYLLAASLAFSSVAVARELPTTTPGPDAARISGVPGQFDQDLFPVTFVEIDGRNIQPREHLWLKPGRYEVTVLIQATDGFRPASTPPGVRRNWDRASKAERRAATTIDVELEAGKTYQIRARYNAEEREGIPYSTVVWKIEESSAGLN